MPRSPSIVPHGVDHDIYLVLNDFGNLGRAWCETDEEGTDRETLIRRLLEDQYSHPVRIVAFNTAEGCPNDTMRNGRAFGFRSAYSRPGGAAPLCYPSDVTPVMIESYKQRQVSRRSGAAS